MALFTAALTVLAALAPMLRAADVVQGQQPGSIDPDKLAELCASGRHLIFHRYEPSSWETEWLQNGEAWAGSICEHMIEAKDRSIQWLQGLETLKDGPNFKALEWFSPDVFSRFIYVDICAPELDPTAKPDPRGDSPKPPREVVAYFEPVVGLMRHPQGGIDECLWPGAKRLHVEQRSHLAAVGMKPRDFDALYPGKAYFFDLGTGTTYKSSLEWFVNEYEHLGVEFDQIYGWELQPIVQSEYWGEHMDRRISSKVHLLNMPVRNDTLAIGQAFQILSNIYRPGDFVSLKLDIDHEVLEGVLIEELRNNPHIRHMIGEMWFEQHHDAEPMVQHYGWKLNYPWHQALKTFNELRSMGIKLHTWP